MRVRLAPTFVPTHETAGLIAYPAVDVFGPAGAEVVADFWGVVRRISGHDPRSGGSPGGAYGWSVYVHNFANGYDRYVTHLGSLRVKVGDHVTPGRIIGTVCDSAVSGKPGTSHVHYGLHRSPTAT